MSLVGNLSTMPLPDLLQWLATAKQSGTLQVERNKLTRRIQFEDGRVVGCTSDDPPQRLGQFLLSRELITPDQLRDALAEQQSSGNHLGTILVELGMLSSENLSKHLEAKAEETIYSIFDWNDGVFRFEPGTRPQRDLLVVNLMVQDVLLRGMKRFDDMLRIRQVFDDPTIILRYSALPPGPEIFENRMARMMYAAIDGDRSVAEILLHVHGSEYIVYKFLYELHRNGYIEIAGHKTRTDSNPERFEAPAPQSEPDELPHLELDLVGDLDLPASAPSTPDPGTIATAVVTPETQTTAGPAAPATSDDIDDDLERARRMMDDGEAEAALELLDVLYRLHPENGALKRLTGEAEANFVQKAYQHVIHPDRIPVLTRPVESLGSESLSPQEFFMLSRVDGTWDVKSIIQVSPLREVDALRTLKRMRELGMIELKDA